MDLNNLDTWHYGAIIGGAVLVLSLIIYFLPARKLKVPAVLTAAIGGLAAGLAVGVIWLAGFGYKLSPPDEKAGDEAAAAREGAGPRMGGGAPKGGGGAPKGGGGGGGAPKGGGGAPKGGFGGGNPPGPRVQLVGLVNALDTLVDKPVTLALSPEDRAAIAEQLQGTGRGGRDQGGRGEGPARRHPEGAREGPQDSGGGRLPLAESGRQGAPEGRAPKGQPQPVRRRPDQGPAQIIAGASR